MYHDPALAAATRVTRPPSAVSGGAGFAGFAGLASWTLVARANFLDGPYSSLVGLAACALAMIAWSLLVDRVHRSATTGLDWQNPQPIRAILDISLTKLAGYWLTWGGIAVVYATGRFYWQGNFEFAMWCFLWSAPALFALSIPYVLWIDRHMIEPRDGAWHLGAWLTGQSGVDRGAVQNHLLSWGVKAFFLPFMLGGVPSGFGAFVRADLAGALAHPVALTQMLIGAMFLIDMGIATVGYVLTFRPLDAHIRSANPFAAAWMPALICYPPFILMLEGGPFDYHQGTAQWDYWLGDHPLLLAAFGAVLVGLTAIYAWATLAFGPRFSNLTHRGILTHGPYAWTKHPAYWSKNLFWWLSVLPWFTTGSPVDAIRATLTLGAVSGIYYWRAKTEERHLRRDPAYVAYSDWIAHHGPIARVRQKLSSAYTREISPPHAPS